MTNEEAIRKLEDVAMELKTQCLKLDKVCMTGMAPPHYVVHLSKLMQNFGIG
jgi:hypothetical protein